MPQSGHVYCLLGLIGIFGPFPVVLIVSVFLSMPSLPQPKASFSGVCEKVLSLPETEAHILLLPCSAYPQQKCNWNILDSGSNP